MGRLALVSLVAVLLLGAVAVAVARPGGSRAARSPDAAVRTITVSGTGTASAVPTRAQLSFGVQTQALTARAALAQNAAAMRDVLDALERAGAKDVRTQSVSLSPTYGNSAQLQGYSASNTVSATVAFASAGTTIDAAVEAGANQVNGPSPLADDAETLYRSALQDAVRVARARGEVLAAAAGARLGPVTAILEGSAPGPIPFAKVAGAADASTPVVPGQQETTATVTVTFALS